MLSKHELFELRLFSSVKIHMMGFAQWPMESGGTLKLEVLGSCIHPSFWTRVPSSYLQVLGCSLQGFLLQSPHQHNPHLLLGGWKDAELQGKKAEGFPRCADNLPHKNVFSPMATWEVVPGDVVRSLEEAISVVTKYEWPG